MLGGMVNKKNGTVFGAGVSPTVRLGIPAVEPVHEV